MKIGNEKRGPGIFIRGKPSRKKNPISTLLLLAGFLFIVQTFNLLGQEPVDVSGLSGQELYLKACARCHGTDGRGETQSLVGFDVPLPDFTDCDFVSREADGDWLAIASLGGPIRGFSEIMPAFGKALSEEDLLKIIRYIRSFCANNNWPRGELNLPRALVTEKAFPEDEAILTWGADGDFETWWGKMIYEQRFGAKNQWELIFPFAWQEMYLSSLGDNAPQKDWRASLGDFALAIKRVLFHHLPRGYILSLGGEVVFPTGDDELGMGKGTFVIEPFLAYGQLLPAEFFLQSQVGFEFPLKQDRAENELFFRLAIGRSFNASLGSRTWSPMIEILGKKELVSGEELILDLLPEVQVTLNQRQHVMLNFGVRFPLTQTRGRDTQFLVYILWDWFDGGLFEGW